MTWEWKPWLHLLIPRWRFFDRLGNCPRLELRMGQGPWNRVLPQERDRTQSWGERTLGIFLVSQLERFVEESQRCPADELMELRCTKWLRGYARSQSGFFEGAVLRIQVLEDPQAQDLEWVTLVEFPC